ncbi:MAG: molybdopterin-binding protein, partial [Candidatus Sumerlaeota bacterium]
MPKAAILSTGTEILQGLYPDTNAQWLSTQLSDMGVDVVCHMAAPDHHEAVAEALRALIEKADLVIMTGGLGPTEDDLNRQAIAEVFECGL